jgi:hypothetical protein
MPSYDQHTVTRSVFGKSTALTLGLLPILAMGCVQQAQPIAPPSPPPPPNTMEITIDQLGNIVPNEVTSGGHHIIPVSNHQVTQQRTYYFGSTVVGGDVCFWDTQFTQKKYCWPNTGSAVVSINRNGIIQTVRFNGLPPISPQNVNATMTRRSHSGPGSYCYWISLGAIYCF